MTRRGVTRWVQQSIWADRILAFVSLSPVGVLVVRQVVELKNRTVPCCDFAALELGTRALLRGDQFIGLYSREGWRHPGPAPFAWSTLFRWLPGHSFAEHQVAAAVLALISLTYVMATSWQHLKPQGRSIVILTTSVFILRFDVNAMRSPWNPYSAAFWAMIAVTATAGFVHTSRRAALAIAVFAASMAAQTHVGAAPISAVCLATIAIVLFRSRHRSPTFRSALLAGGVILVMWILPILDLIDGNRNMWKILTSSPGGESMSQSKLVESSMWAIGNSPGRIGQTFGPASPYVEVRSAVILDILVLVFVLVACVVAAVRIRNDRFIGLVALLSLCSVVLTVSTLSVAHGPFLRYLLLPMTGLAVLLWSCSGITLSRLFQRHELKILKVLAWPAVFGLSAWSILGIDTHLFTDRYAKADITDPVNAIERRCSDLPRQSIVSIDDAVEWFDALPLIVAIDRCSRVKIIGHVGFLAGQPFQAAPSDEANVFISGTSTPARGTVLSTTSTVNVWTLF